MKNQMRCIAKIPIIQVEAPTARPQGFEKEAEKRFPATPETKIRSKNLKLPKKCSLLFPSISSANRFMSICQMLRWRTVGAISR